MADEMLIDGLIKFCDAKSKNMELKAEPQVYVEIKCALEELKAIKSDGFTDHLLNMGYTKGYRNGIDEFAEKLKANSELGYIGYLDRVVDEIAEQLKGGAE